MSSLSIKITNMRCDAKCGYCYEGIGRDMPSKTDRPLNIPAVLKQMDYEWQRMTQMYGPENMSGEPYLHGGEALLAGHETVEKIMKKAYELAGRTNIQTYGYLIDDKYIEIFKKYKASVGISIDGPWPLNKARPVSGMSTKAVTELVHKNILRLREEDINVSIICVLTKANATPDKLPQLKEWLLWLRDIGVNSGRLNLAHMDLKQYGKGLELTEEEAENAWRELTKFVLIEEEGLYWQPMHDAVSSMLGLEQGTCIAGSELVFDGNGDLVPIGKWDRDSVLTFSDGDIKPVSADWRYMGRKQVVKVTTDTGRSLRLTPDHRVWTKKGWVEAKDLVGQDVLVRPSISFTPPEHTSSDVIITEDDIVSIRLDHVNGVAPSNPHLHKEGPFSWLKGKRGRFYRDIFEKMPIKSNTEEARALARLLGIIQSDGHLTKKAVSVHVGERSDAERVASDARLLGLSPTINLMKTDRSVVFRVHLGSRPAAALFLSVGATPGRKIISEMPIPVWVKRDRRLLWEFLRGFLSGDAGISIVSGRLRCHIYKYFEEEHKQARVDMVKDLSDAFREFGFDSTVSEHKRGKYSYFILKLHSIGELLHTFDLPYSNQKNTRSMYLMEYEGWRARFPKGTPRSDFDTWLSSRVSSSEGMIWQEVVSVTPDGEDDVYDIEVKHHSHRFFANGIVVHNCVFNECEYFHAAAEPVVLSDGSTANCLKTAKTGNMYPRLEQPEYESRGFGRVRYEVLQQIPFELSSKGGCKGCTYWRNCLGGCPAEGTGGDWRNKTRFCRAYYGLFEEAHKALKRLMPTIITTADATDAMFDEQQFGRGVRGMNPPAFARMLSQYTKTPSSWRGSSYVPLPTKENQDYLKSIEHLDGPIRHLDSNMRQNHGDSHGDHNDAGRGVKPRKEQIRVIKSRLAESELRIKEMKENSK